MEGDFTSEEAIREAKRLEKPLTDTTAGAVGKFVGENLPLMVATGGGASAVRGGLAAARGGTSALRGAAQAMLPQSAGAARAASLAAKQSPVLQKALLAGGEGAIQGLATSDVGQGAEGALAGGAFGGALSGLGSAAGGILRKARTEITPEAREIMKKTGAFIPASQALPEGSFGRQFYEGILSNAFSSGGKIRGQRTEAVDAARNLLTRKALPIGSSPVGAFQRGDRMSDVMDHLKREWDRAYDGINRSQIRNVSIPTTVSDAVEARSTSAIMGGAPSIRTSGNMSGADALDLSKTIQNLIDEIPVGDAGRKAERDLLVTTRRNLERHIENELPWREARKFVKNRDQYKNYLGIKAAADAATKKNKEFTLDQATGGLVKSKSGQANLAADMATTLKDFPSRQGMFQQAAANALIYGGLGAAGGYAGYKADGGTGAGAGMAAAMLSGPRALARPGVQKALFKYASGPGVLDRYAKALRRMGQAGRAAGVGIVTDPYQRD
jgi:hypothetical protein